jgi:hypothetical protein
MSEPERWTQTTPDDPDEAKLSELFRRAGPPAPLDGKGRQRILGGFRSAVEQPHTSFGRMKMVGFGLAAATALIAVGLLVSVLHHEEASKSSVATSEVNALGEVAASPDAHYRLVPSASSGDKVLLEIQSGSLKIKRDAKSPRTVSLRSPGLVATLEALEFRVQVAGDVTTLWVDQGSASVSSSSGPELHLSSGEWVRSDDRRLLAMAAQPATPSDAPQVDVVARCSRLTSLRERKSCFTQLALGSDLAAQNALLELGMLEAEELHDGASAIEDWRAYQQRFPRGSLGPEASFAILSELLAEHRTNEARIEADHFLASYADGARSNEVRLTRANLRCATSGAEALEAFDALLKENNPSIRGEALFGRAVCLERLGRPSEARVDFESYASEFPQGTHWAEAKRHLGE